MWGWGVETTDQTEVTKIRTVFNFQREREREKSFQFNLLFEPSYFTTTMARRQNIKMDDWLLYSSLCKYICIPVMKSVEGRRGKKVHTATRFTVSSKVAHAWSAVNRPKPAKHWEKHIKHTVWWNRGTITQFMYTIKLAQSTNNGENYGQCYAHHYVIYLSVI